MKTNNVDANAPGPIAWMARNSVAANLLMIVLLVGGLMTMGRIKQEVFPEFNLDYVRVSVPYPGASPEEIERGIIEAIEEEVRGVDGVKRVTSTAVEGSGSVIIELITGTDRNQGLQDIKSAVDRITSFPQDAERPVVSLISNRKAVVSLILYGELSEHQLYLLAEKVRDELLQEPGITLVEVVGTRPPEVSIEVPRQNLRAYNLTLPRIADEVRRAAVELPGGGVKTPGGEILLRTDERRDFGSEFNNIPVITRKDGSQVLLADIATVRDGFRDIDRAAYFYGQPAVQIVAYRVGEQTPLDISEAVWSYRDTLQSRLPEGIQVAVWSDRAEVYRDRIDLLLRNASMGLILVLLVLGLFLEPRLAFWVTMGIPISFLGSFLLMPAMDVSINMISLFAFIISLGIVVDDAIVVGENIYEYRQRGYRFLDAAVAGARSVKVPVTFAILTNIAAFMPMFFVPGVTGKIFAVIPAIVVSVFLISWVESLFILPAHLAHQKPATSRSAIEARIQRLQARFQSGLQRVIDGPYAQVCTLALRNRYISVAVACAVFVVALGYVFGGRINFTFLPKIDSDVIAVTAALPYGSPVEETEQVIDTLYDGALRALEPHGGLEATRGIFSIIGSTPVGFGPGPTMSSPAGGHLAGVMAFLVPSDQRNFDASQFSRAWRQQVGEIHGLESLAFKYNTGPSAGAPIDIELSHPDIAVLETAAAELAEELKRYSGIKDIDDGFAVGKPQLSFEVRPHARALGLTASDLARQVRAAFYGARALRQQRGRDEIWVMVRLPEEERRSERDIEKLLIRTSEGGEVPLLEAAKVTRGRAYTEIKRADGRRVVNVTADVEENVTNADKVLADVQSEVLPALLEAHPGLRVGFEGARRDQSEGVSALISGFAFSMLVVFALLAIPFGSYVQPLLVMSVIPFGFIGALIGHVVMGFDFSVISIFGIIALAGVVINDSLVLIYHANELRDWEDLTVFDAVLAAGKRRFRPILLTSLTTFFGLAPMIFETSVQARFLIPMALSLGFGVLFATVIALLLVPVLYLILDDMQKLAARSLGGVKGRAISE